MVMLPRYHDTACDDMGEYSALLAGPWELEHRQLSAGNVRAHNRGIQVGASVAYEESFTRAVSVVGVLGPGLVCFSFPNKLAEAEGRWWGAAHPGNAVSFATDCDEIKVSFPAGYQNILVLVDGTTLRESYVRHTGEEPGFLRPGVFHLPVLPRTVTQYRSALRQLINQNGTVPIAQDAVVQLIVRLLTDAAAIASGEPHVVPAPKSRTRIVRRAIDHWRDSEFELSVAELSRQLGVSQRTLDYSFRDHFGHSPHQYLKRCRLGCARERLLRSHRSETSVTEIATSCGFYELGRFAGEYLRFFGELPSQTLATPASKAEPLF